MKIRPETFDILGVFVFPYIGFLALHSLITRNPPSDTELYILLFIGVVGFAIDGTIVYITYVKKRKDQ